MCWSRPALTFAKRRYADALDEKRHVASRLTLFPADSPEDETRNRGIDAPIDCVARLFSFIGNRNSRYLLVSLTWYESPSLTKISF